MELGKQIRKQRDNLNMSQDQLAEKVFVSRQTISNWENDKSYPDIKSLIILSYVFNVSLDELIKGDLQEMKEKINQQDIINFNKDSVVFTVMFLLMVATPLPLTHYLGAIGWWIWAIIVAISLYYAFKIEKYKKTFDVQTYKEILAFTKGESLTNEDKLKEQGKRPYQKIMIVTAVTVLALIFSLVMFLFLK